MNDNVETSEAIDTRTIIALLDKNGENVVPKLIAAIGKETNNKNNYFGLSTSSTKIKRTSLEDLEATKLSSASACGYFSTKSASKNEPFTSKTANSTLMFEGRVFSEEPKNALENSIKRNLGADPETTANSILKNVEGEFACIITQKDIIVAARDPIGIQPLYYGTNSEVAAIASNRKALWHMGIDQPRSFPPGNIGLFSKEGCKFSPSKVLQFERPNSITIDEAADTLRLLLETSVRMRIAGQKKVAVAFSGGLDSSVVAWLSKKSEVETRLIHVSLENQPETEEAKKAASALGLPLSVHLFRESDVERDISKVVELVEDREPISASVGLPFYWNAQKAAEAGFRVVLAGQGADELFGGYLRYVKEYLLKGDEAYRRTMFHDLSTIHESNIERDEKICNFWDVELRLPFGSYQVVEFALSLPTAAKFEKKIDSPRKLVLRKAAEKMGIPKDIVEKPKKAVQYSTGTSSQLKKIAKKQNLSLSEYVNKIFQKTLGLR